MTLTNAEQYMLELINRARLDPLAEAARLGIDLNAGLAPGTLGPQARQVLAPNELLEASALDHSQWMLAADVFSHTGENGSSPFDRMRAAGYTNYVAAAENISWRGSTGAMNLEAAIALQHDSLFKSAGHRTNILNGSLREIGIAQEAGVFTLEGTNYNSSMVTQNFGSRASVYFVTGVAYQDSNGDGFYSIGEGRSGVSFAGSLGGATSTGTGGYAMQVTPGAAVSVTGSVGGTAFAVTLDTGLANAKLDVVDGTTFHSSADITLVSGLNHARLLGVADLDATGNGAANRLEGNSGANVLTGGGGADSLSGGQGLDLLIGDAGADRLFGQDGHDTLQGGGGDDALDGGEGSDVLQGDAGQDRLTGGKGDDRLNGGDGHDTLQGGNGADRLNGGAGDDVLNGGTGNDVLTGGSQADVFVFSAGPGLDRITDLQSGDRIQLDDAIWGGSAKTSAQVVADHGQLVGGVAVLDFGAAHKITLDGIITLSGLDSYLTIL